jgi:hypothetical protein
MFLIYETAYIIIQLILILYFYRLCLEGRKEIEFKIKIITLRSFFTHMFARLFFFVFLIFMALPFILTQLYSIRFHNLLYTIVMGMNSLGVIILFFM